MLLHYYKNNFTRHCPNIKEAVTKRQTFSFTETVAINRLVKSTNGLKLIYGGGTLP